MTTKLPTTYDECLAKMLQGVASRVASRVAACEANSVAACEANSVGGEFFTLSGGILKFGGNQAGVVILDHIFENVYYSGEYDPNSPSAPVCYAFAVEESDIAPHPNVVQAGLNQHEPATAAAGSFDQGGRGNIFDLTSDPTCYTLRSH